MASMKSDTATSDLIAVMAPSPSRDGDGDTV